MELLGCTSKNVDREVILAPSLMLMAFDYDGVLVDSLARLLGIVRQAQAMIGHGRAPREEDFRTIANLTFPALGALLGMSAEDTPLFHSQVLALQRQETSLPELFPGIAQIIPRLAAHSVLVVVTASARAEVERVLEVNALTPYISQIFDGADPRPKAAKITAACALFAQEPACTYMVGDTQGDITQGKLAGVQTIGVTWGYQSSALLQIAGPDYLIDTPEDMIRVVS